MPSSRASRRLQDIIDNAQAIAGYIEGLDETTFMADRKTYDAVERCLERICEASAKLGDEAASLMPDQPWHKIRAFGNALRHEYDTVQPDRLFNVVKTDLPNLCTACETALRNLQQQTPQAPQQPPAKKTIEPNGPNQ